MPAPIKPKRLIIYPKENSPGKKDASTFSLGATLYTQYRKEVDPDFEPPDVFIFNNKQGKLAQATSLLKKMEEEIYTHYIFFCHGYPTGIQPGIYSPKWKGYNQASNNRFFSIWDSFITLIARIENPRVILFSCSTGGEVGDEEIKVGDNSFGDLVRDELAWKYSFSSFVFSHTNAGHSWWNPYVRIFEGDGNPYGAVGGSFIALPGTPEFTRLSQKLEDDGLKEYRAKLPVSQADCLAWKIPDLPKSEILTLI